MRLVLGNFALMEVIISPRFARGDRIIRQKSKELFSSGACLLSTFVPVMKLQGSLIPEEHRLASWIVWASQLCVNPTPSALQRVMRVLLSWHVPIQWRRHDSNSCVRSLAGDDVSYKLQELMSQLLNHSGVGRMRGDSLLRNLPLYL